jgi:hypothetical protein
VTQRQARNYRNAVRRQADSLKFHPRAMIWLTDGPANECYYFSGDRFYTLAGYYVSLAWLAAHDIPIDALTIGIARREVMS